jgi:hypothetical protein
MLAMESVRCFDIIMIKEKRVDHHSTMVRIEGRTIAEKTHSYVLLSRFQ